MGGIIIRFIEDILKKEVIDPEAKTMGKITDIVFDDETFEITDIVVKKTGIADSIKSNGENVVPISMVGAVGDKILIKRDDEI